MGGDVRAAISTIVTGIDALAKTAAANATAAAKPTSTAAASSTSML